LLVQPLGSELHAGLALLGLVSPLLPLPADAYREALRSSKRPDVDASWRVFERGRELFGSAPRRVVCATVDPLDIDRARR